METIFVSLPICFDEQKAVRTADDGGPRFIADHTNTTRITTRRCSAAYTTLTTCLRPSASPTLRRTRPFNWYQLIAPTLWYPSGLSRSHNGTARPGEGMWVLMRTRLALGPRDCRVPVQRTHANPQSPPGVAAIANGLQNLPLTGSSLGTWNPSLLGSWRSRALAGTTCFRR